LNAPAAGEPWYRWDEAALLLRLRIQPRAAKDELCGPHGDRLKVRITAPPVDGKANDHLCRFLAERCGVAASRVALVAGETGRDKTVRIESPQRLPAGVSR
jgi:uncharacterized protein (TIGR00251 family)